MRHSICVTCGTQYSACALPPESCAICTDSRQFVGFDGQQWTTLDDLHRGVSAAATALSEAELVARGVSPDAWMQSVAPEDLSHVGRLCDSAASVGVEIASHLKMASESIEDARPRRSRRD